MGHGQPKVIIWTNFDGPKAPMLYTKTQGHWLFGSREENFWRIFTIYGRGGHLGLVTQMPQTNFRSPDPWRLHMKFGFDWPSGFEEDLWKWWTDNRPCLYYNLTNEPKGSGELTSSMVPVKTFRTPKKERTPFYFLSSPVKQWEVTMFAKGDNLIASLSKIGYFPHRIFLNFLFQY